MSRDTQPSLHVFGFSLAVTFIFGILMIVDIRKKWHWNWFSHLKFYDMKRAAAIKVCELKFLVINTPTQIGN